MIIYYISSWIGDPTSNIPLKVQIQRYRCLKVDILGFYVSAIGSWRMSFAKPLRWSSYCKILYKIPSWTDAPFSYIPIKVQIQRYRCLKLDILFFMFRQSALEEWVLPILNVWPHSLRKYTIFQVGLTIQLAIFLSKYQYKDTDVWNLTYWVWCFGNRLLKNEFCQVLIFDLICYENIQYFKLDWRSN